MTAPIIDAQHARRRNPEWTDSRMREAYLAGDGMARIAHLAGVSRQRVEQIVKGYRTSRQPKQQPLERRIAFAERALPEWRAGLATWTATGRYRGRPVDAAWLARERAELRELECALARWRREEGQT